MLLQRYFERGEVTQSLATLSSVNVTLNSLGKYKPALNTVPDPPADFWIIQRKNKSMLLTRITSRNMTFHSITVPLLLPP